MITRKTITITTTTKYVLCNLKRRKETKSLKCLKKKLYTYYNNNNYEQRKRRKKKKKQKKLKYLILHIN